MISMVVAMDENRVIGKDGDLPWHLPNDLKFFKRVTTGHTIIMGRKTHESIGRPLPDRRNIVVTTQQSYAPEGVEVLHSLEEVKQFADKKEEEFFLIGGETLFRQLLPVTGRIYLTVIHDEFEGDTYFPEISEDEWEVVSSEKGETDEKNIYEHTFLVYERKK
ncbi:dihydrofolate reductase [Evansella clarkii]|uniref:dihydrofolate reductase n=1 Tax=Evansella clarkii TaxID=79879 RepID=UPI000B440CA8|nr:dihydrofolate reductase [Evansella clarkii]